MAYRRKLTPEERAAIEGQLAAARRTATVVERDGRQFTLLRLDDRYGERGPVGGIGEPGNVSERLDSLDDDE